MISEMKCLTNRFYSEQQRKFTNVKPEMSTDHNGHNLTNGLELLFKQRGGAFIVTEFVTITGVHNCSLLPLFDFKHTCDSCSFHPFPWPHNCFLCRAGTRCPCGVEDAVVTSGSSRGRGEQRVGGVWGVVWLSAQDPGEMIIWRWSRLPTDPVL